MRIISKVIRFNVQMENVEKVDSRFSKCKIRVLYAGLNRNNTYISEKVINEAASSAFNMPIVGEYDSYSENFEGHGGKIDVTGEKPEYVETTIPYGFVPETAELYWEEVTEDDGKVNKYFVIDGAYLWTDRYQEAAELLKNEFNQSMEIKNIEGNFSTIDGKKVYEVKKFMFLGFCILGINKETDPHGHVEPCFESASIVGYSLIDTEFKKEFKNMVQEIIYSLKGEGNLKNKFALTATQMFAEAEKEIKALGTYTDPYWEMDIQKYYLVDIDSTNSNVIAFDNQKHQLVGATFSIDGDKFTIDAESIKRFKVDYTPMDIDVESNFSLTGFSEFAKQVKENTENKVKSDYENKVVEIENKFELLQQEYEDVNSKYSEKLVAEREQAEVELFEHFSSELTEDEMKTVKEDKANLSLDDIESKLYTLVGKKKAKFSFNTNKPNLISVNTGSNTNKKEDPIDKLMNGQI